MHYNDRMTILARLGFAARGFVYVLVGWFALDAARHGGRPSDNQGVMGSLIDAPLGKAMLGVCALGFAATPSGGWLRQRWTRKGMAILSRAE